MSEKVQNMAEKKECKLNPGKIIKERAQASRYEREEKSGTIYFRPPFPPPLVLSCLHASSVLDI